MRFLNYLDTPESDALQRKADETYEKIRKECAPFLREVKGSKYEALRGTRKTIARTGEKLIARTDRHPLETPQKVHDMINASFKKKFGWFARSEAVFANSTKKTSVAVYYGIPYYFYPVGNFEYLWSPKTVDIVLYLNYVGVLSQDYKLMDDVTDEDIQEAIDKILPTYKKTGLKDALSNAHEVMYRCKEYYMVHTDYHKKYKDI